MTDDAWNESIGMIWSALLTRHCVDRDGVIVEIGPGFEDKIGRALAKCQFRGTVYVVEPCGPAREWITSRYALLLPHATIMPIVAPIPAATALLPRTVDAMLMNHVLDDLLLFAALPAATRDAVFSRMRADDAGVAQAVGAWRALLANPDTLRAHRSQVIDDVRGLLRHTRPRFVGVNHYASWRQRDHGLDDVDRLGAGMLGAIGSATLATAAADRALLEQHGQDPARWLVSSTDSQRRGTARRERHALAGGRSA